MKQNLIEAGTGEGGPRSEASKFKSEMGTQNSTPFLAESLFRTMFPFPAYFFSTSGNAGTGFLTWLSVCPSAACSKGPGLAFGLHFLVRIVNEPASHPLPCTGPHAELF